MHCVGHMDVPTFPAASTMFGNNSNSSGSSTIAIHFKFGRTDFTAVAQDMASGKRQQLKVRYPSRVVQQ